MVVATGHPRHLVQLGPIASKDVVQTRLAGRFGLTGIAQSQRVGRARVFETGSDTHKYTLPIAIVRPGVR